MKRSRSDEEVGEISVSVWKEDGFLGSRRWSGFASAEWGSVSSGKRYRSQRSLRKALLSRIRRHQPQKGSDVDETLLQLESGERNFRDRDLKFVNLRGRELSGSDFSNSDLFRSMLDDAVAKGSDLSFAYLAHASLKRSDFSGCTLTGAAFYRVDCSHVDFSRAVLDADMDESKFPNFRTIPMESWSGWLYFVDCDLSESNFDESALVGAFFKRCNLTRATFRRAVLTGVRFIDCESEGINLVGASLDDSYFGEPRAGDDIDWMFP